MEEKEIVERLKAAGYQPEPEGFLWVFNTRELLDVAARLSGVAASDCTRTAGHHFHEGACIYCLAKGGQ